MHRDIIVINYFDSAIGVIVDSGTVETIETIEIVSNNNSLKLFLPKQDGWRGII